MSKVTALHTTVHESASTTRRGLIGSAIAAAVGTPERTARKPAAAPPTTSSAPPKKRAIASRPYANGGPVDRDQSMAETVGTGATSVPTGAQYATYSAAARAAKPAPSALFDVTDIHAHLLRRATFGARASDVSALKKLGVEKWLTKQLAPHSFSDTSGDAAWKAFPLAGATPATIHKKVTKYGWDAMYATAQATLGRQIFSNRQLYEIVIDIFTAHLHVAVPGEQWDTSPGYIVNVIRKYSFGKFSDMLLHAMKHPAMLSFLGNDQSYKAHVNENLGRELLELHTVGVASGYTENDVKASAAILSGRTIDYPTGAYHYDATRHETGPVTVLGFSAANATGAGGEKVGDDYLRYLAHHPGTARNIARKIATRFVSDEPSDDLLDRLVAVYLKHDTSILEVVKAVFRSSDFWSVVGIRMRRPLEDAVGTVRVLGISRPSTAAKTAKGITSIYWALVTAGNAPLGWNPPNGYPDVAAAWLGAGTMIQSWNLHRAVIYGWWGGFAFANPMKFVTITKGMTAGKWMSAVAQKLLGTAPTPDHLAAMLAGMGLTATSGPPGWEYQAGEGMALALDSAYFQLR